MLAQLEAQTYSRARHFLTVLAEQLQGEANTFASVQQWIEKWLNQPLAEVVRAEHAREAAESVATAQAFGNLRLLSQLDFADIFEAVSVVEAELRLDPAGIYPRSDFATRDQCRRVVEQIARASAKEEIEVARFALDAARTAEDPSCRHVMHFLLAEGVSQLERSAEARPRLRIRLHRSIRKHATAVYLASIATLSLCFVGTTVVLGIDA